MTAREEYFYKLLLHFLSLTCNCVLLSDSKRTLKVDLHRIPSYNEDMYVHMHAHGQVYMHVHGHMHNYVMHA